MLKRIAAVLAPIILTLGLLTGSPAQATHLYDESPFGCVYDNASVPRAGGKLKAQADVNGRHAITIYIWDATNNRQWKWVLTHNGDHSAQGTTAAGSSTRTVATVNFVGTDIYRVNFHNLANTARCVAEVRLTDTH